MGSKRNKSREKIKIVDYETEEPAEILSKQFRGAFIEYQLKLKKNDKKILKVVELNTGKEQNIGEDVFIEYKLQKLSI